MISLRVYPKSSLRGNVRLPGDKSMSHRALMLAAIADGESNIRGLSASLDVQATAEAFRQMGLNITLESEVAKVIGRGQLGLSMPQRVVDCGNSGTSMRLLAGLLSSSHFGVVLDGDESLRSRPMARIIEPLKARGAHIAGRRSEDDERRAFAPISIAPQLSDERLRGIEFQSPRASAQVKSTLMLSGLRADGPTTVIEPFVSRDHSERMLMALGVEIEVAGAAFCMQPHSGSWRGFDWTIPKDFSAAAFWMAAAATVPDSILGFEGIGLNPTRTGMLDVLRWMRADVASEARGTTSYGEPIGNLAVRSATNPLGLGGTSVGDETLVRSIDEIPAIAVVAAAANGETKIVDASELRHKESDRIHDLVEVLHAFGVEAEEFGDGFSLRGSKTLRAAEIDAKSDHRLAMAAAILALRADGPSVIHGCECIATSDPYFVDSLRELGVEVEAIHHDN